MPKRKREDLNESETTAASSRKLTLRATRLEHKINHGVQQIHRALKTARGFERQKLGRRQKNAQKNNDAQQLSRLSEEVRALKSLDLFETSKKHLIKQLMRTKRIAESPVLAELELQKQITHDGKKDGPEANVLARLFSSNPAKAVLPGVMDGIRGILGLDDTKPATDKVSAARKQSKTATAMSSKAAANAPSAEPAHSDLEDISMSGSGEDLPFAEFDDRIASSSGSEDKDDDRHIQQRKESRYDPVEDLSLSPTPSLADSESPPPTKIKRSKTKSIEKASATTFLPSLTMGGYWSGTESEVEDDDAITAVEPRKNRMGQAARRKLWEKKYGSNANHMKKQAQRNGRDSGWDMRRGAMASSDRGRGRGRGGQDERNNQTWDERIHPDRRFGQSHGSNRREEDNKPIHPSWEAAKKAKEKKNNATFEGKKVLFD